MRNAGIYRDHHGAVVVIDLCWLKDETAQTRIVRKMVDRLFASRNVEPAISQLGVRYAEAMSEIARGDRESSSIATELLPRKMKRIPRFISKSICHLAPPTMPYIQSATIYRNSTWRLGVVRLGPNVSIPLHDHPGAYALSQVLTGEINLDAFASATGGSRGVTQLHHAWSTRNGPGESAILDPRNVNIHRIKASQDGAVVLTAAFAVRRLSESRHWFIALGKNRKDTFKAIVIDQMAVNTKSWPGRLDQANFGRIPTGMILN